MVFLIAKIPTAKIKPAMMVMFVPIAILVSMVFAVDKQSVAQMIFV